MADETNCRTPAGAHATRARPCSRYPLTPGRLWISSGSPLHQLCITSASGSDQPDRTALTPDRSNPRPGSGNLLSHVTAPPDDPPWASPSARDPARPPIGSNGPTHQLTPALIGSNARSPPSLKRPFTSAQTTDRSPSSNVRSDRLKRIRPPPDTPAELQVRERDVHLAR
jgi:hypothetical protein